MTSASNEGLTSGAAGLILGDLTAMLISLLLVNNGRLTIIRLHVQRGLPHARSFQKMTLLLRW